MAYLDRIYSNIEHAHQLPRPLDGKTRAEMDLAYRKKLDMLSNNLDKVQDPLAVTANEWTDDLSLWPAVEFGQIYTYLIDTPGQFTKEKMKCYKSLEAYNYYIR